MSWENPGGKRALSEKKEVDAESTVSYFSKERHRNDREGERRKARLLKGRSRSTGGGRGKKKKSALVNALGGNIRRGSNAGKKTYQKKRVDS